MRWFAKRKGGQDEYLVKNVGMGCRSSSGLYYPGSSIGKVAVWAGDDGVCDPRRSLGGGSHPRDNGFSSQARGTLERHRRGNQRAVIHLGDQRGQSTVEFAVVTAGFLALLVGLGTFVNMLGDGVIIQHALASASHHLQDVPAPFIADVFRY